MRPVERGVAPRTYAKYEEAINDLEEKLGSYCNYCERRLPTSLAVEHIVPKSLHPALANEWTNFLLSCGNCNSVKSNKSVEIGDFLWCDRDNTFLAFTYSKGGFVQLSDILKKEQKIKAEALLNLVGLQRHQESSQDQPRPRDKRWKDRKELWTIAERCRDSFDLLNQADAAKYLILSTAQAYGFFSVWMTVFDNYPDIKKELISSFPGTATSCFDPNGNPINRPGSII